MARKAEKEKTKDGLKLKIVNPNAAGIDIAYGEMQVCVPEDRDCDNNRCFGSFTCDYEEIASWLKACGITTVAMESTGSYWVGLYFFLEEKGFDVLLANAKEVKNVSGKKTNEADAEWIMLMHSYGLLKPSFQIAAAQEFLNENRSADLSRVKCLLHRLLPREYFEYVEQLREHQDTQTIINIMGGQNMVAPKASSATQSFSGEKALKKGS